MPRVVLLGPQRSAPTLPRVLREERLDGPLAVVTAGWEDREDDTGALAEAVERPLVNLRAWHAAEAAFGRDREFLEAWRDRRLRIREQQATYRLRLTAEVETLLALLRRTGPADVLTWQREELLEALRTLDDRHHARMEEIQAEFEDRWRPRERTGVARQAKRMAEQVASAAAVLIAGGHVGVLASRLRLFDLGPAIRRRPVFAWSAGAMVAAERVLLFHDSPPQGRGYPEVMGPGLGLCRGAVLLPDAHRRLDLGDPLRVAALARRLAPRRAVLLEEGSGLVFTNGRWEAAAGGAERIADDGSLRDALAA